MTIQLRRGSAKSRFGGFFCLGLFALFLLLCSPASAAQSRTAYLDPSFGDQGRTVTNVALEGPWSQTHVERSPGGEIVVAGSGVVARYMANGELDDSFGEGRGIVRIDDPEGLEFSLSDLAVDPEGKVVLFGTAVDRMHPSSTSFAYPPGPLYPSFAMALRYTQGGRLDPTFGEGDGVVLTTFGLPMDRGYKVTAATASSGALDAQGRIVMVGGVTTAAGSCIGHTAFGELPRLVARLTSAGTFDPSFGGGDGIVGIGTAFASYPNMATTADGSTMLLGRHELCSGPLFLLRTGANGTPDPVPKGARVRMNRRYVTDIGLDRRGGLLLLTDRTGSGRPSAPTGWLMRLRASGRPDRSFGRNGEMAMRLPGKWSSMTSLCVDSSGRILVTGSLTPRRLETANQSWFALFRFSPSGRREWKLGPYGRVVVGFEQPTYVGADGLAIDEADRAVLAGTFSGPADTADKGLVLARIAFGS